MIFIPNIESISKIVDKYDLFILDQWGVMHDGKAGYSHSIDCVDKLVQLKKKIIIISNTSKRKETTIEKLTKLGFKKNDFFEVMTSGEIIWQNLCTKSHKFIKTLGPNCYYLFDETKEEGLEYMARWNMTMLQSDDLVKAATKMVTKAEEPAEFSKL